MGRGGGTDDSIQHCLTSNGSRIGNHQLGSKKRHQEDLTLRIAVGSKEKRGSVWRVWAQSGGNDIYLAARHWADAIKVSLHQSGVWRLAWTDTYHSKISDQDAAANDRLIHRWNRPTEKDSQFTPAVGIFVPHSEVRLVHPLDRKEGGKNIIYVPTSNSTNGTMIAIALRPREMSSASEAVIAGTTLRPHPVAHIIKNPDGDWIWVLIHPMDPPTRLWEKVGRKPSDLNYSDPVRDLDRGFGFMPPGEDFDVAFIVDLVEVP